MKQIRVEKVIKKGVKRYVKLKGYYDLIVA